MRKAVVMPGKFGNHLLRATKRNLSVLEKSTLPTTDHRALILPGSPNTEIEELVRVGYNPCYIFGVEHDESIYRQLVKHYHDSANIFCGDVFDWMKKVRARGEYSYIHLDMCGHLNRDIARDMQRWIHLVAPVARVRVSVSRSHRMPLQMDFEEQIHHDLLLRWCQVGYDVDAQDPERWVALYNHFEETTDDTTKAIAAIMITNFFFGIMDYRAYIDDCRENNESYIPTVEGTHIIKDIKRWTYNEPGSTNYMSTIWVDLAPLPANPLRNSSQWILDGLHDTLSALNFCVPNYTM